MSRHAPAPCPSPACRGGGLTFAVGCSLALVAASGGSAGADTAADPPRVVSITPAAAALPANVLRFYVTFSRPMREGREVLARVRLLDEAGRAIPAPWRDLDLWNDDGTRLSLFVHPGRVKQGVNLRVEQGPVLEPGRRYTLVVDAALRDTRGVPLVGPVAHAFTATAELHDRIDETAWRWSQPAPGGLAPLEVAFDRPLDEALVARALRVHDAADRPVDGRGTLAPDGRRWRFMPAAAWQRGGHRLAVDPVLEDVCGNTPARPFDLDRAADAASGHPDGSGE
jgi:hypothetical protein